MSKIVPKRKTKTTETKELEKAPSAKKRDWTRMLSTIGLILGLSAIWFYLAAMITGHNGIKGPWNLLTHKSQGQYAILFTGMIIIAVLISIKRGVISWAPAQKMVIFASILLAIQVLGLSIWQEDWKPREWLQSIGKNKPANAHPGPTALKDYKTYHPGTYYFNLKAGETTKQWIMFPYGRHNKYTIFSEDDQIAVTDQKIKMVIK
jgi:protein-S-isoprenylcysteine O-methyltransferase Ste14